MSARDRTADIPTENHYRQLRILGDGVTVALVPGFREWEPLVKRGWVQPAWAHSITDIRQSGRSKFFPPLRISVAGLHALARGAEKHGLPELASEKDTAGRR